MGKWSKICVTGIPKGEDSGGKGVEKYPKKFPKLDKRHKQIQETELTTNKIKPKEIHANTY
jgi:hypothetical protein